MSAEDFIREVDEHLHYEKMEKMWKQYKYQIYTGVALVFAGVAGSQYYMDTSDKKLQAQAETYWQAVYQSGEEKVKTLEPLLSQGTQGFEVLSAIRTAEELVSLDQNDAAYAQLQGILSSNGVSDMQRHIVNIYQAQILVNTDPVKADELLTSLIDEQSPFMGTALEMRGQIAESANDKLRAIGFYERIVDMVNVPGSTKFRAQERLTELKK